MNKTYQNYSHDRKRAIARTFFIKITLLSLSYTKYKKSKKLST